MSEQENLNSESESDSAVPESTANTERSLSSLFTGELPLQTPTAFFILANVLDICWTNILMRAGAIEANPFANAIFERYGFSGMIGFKLLIVAIVCVIAQVVALKKINSARFLLWFGTALVGCVVVWSIYLFATNFRHEAVIGA